MPTKIDELYWDITARDRNLDRDLARIQRKMKNAGERMAKELRETLDFNPIRAFERQAGRIAGKKSGKQIAKEMLDGMEDEFKTRGALAREQLFKGQITRREFEEEGRKAGRKFNEGVLVALKDLRRRGLLDDRTQQEFAARLKDTGEQGGRGFGETFNKSVIQSFFKLQRVLRVAFAGGILSLVTLITRRMTAAFRRLSSFIAKTIREAGDLGRIQRAFEQLSSAVQIAPQSLLRRAREASAGLVNDLNLIKQLNFALQAGLPATEDQLGRLVFVARRLGESVGRDATEAFERLVNAIVKQERRVLDELGIVVRFQKAHKDWAKQMGITNRALTTQETILANLETVTGAAEAAVARLGDETDDAGKKFQRLKTTFENIRLAFLDIVNSSVPLLEVLDEFGLKAESIADNIDNNFVQIATKVDLFIVRLRAAVEEFIEVSGLLLRHSTPGGAAAPSVRTFFEGASDVRDLIRAFQTGDFLGREQGLDAAMFERIRTFQEEQRLLRERIRGYRSEQGLIERIRQTREKIDTLLKNGVDKDDERVKLLQGQLGILQNQSRTIENRLRREAAAIEQQILLGQFRFPGRLPGESEREQTERLANAKELQETLDAINALIGVFVGLWVQGEKEAEEAIKSSVLAARERLKILEEEVALLKDFGATTFANIQNEALRKTLQQIRALDNEIRDLRKTLKEAGVDSELATERLDALNKQRGILLVRARRLRDTPEEQISASAKEATEALERLNKQRSIFRRFDVVGALPSQAQDAVAELDAVNSELEKYAQLVIDAAVANEDDLVESLLKGQVTLQEQRQALIELLSTFKEVEDVLKAFPDLGAEFFANLDPEQLANVVSILRKIASATARVAKAERELKLAQASRQEERIKRAQAALRQAELDRLTVISQLEAEINQLNISEEERAQLLEILADLTKIENENTKEFIKNLRGIRAGVRGVLQLADAFGKLNQQTRQALQGIENILSGVEQFTIGFATGNPFQIFGGIVQGIGGLANFFSGIFGGGGPSPEQIRMREEADKTADALRSLAESANQLDAALSGLTGKQLLFDFSGLPRAIEEAIAEQFDPSELDPGETFAPEEIAAFRLAATREALRDLGITITDLEAISQATGVDVSALIELLKGGTPAWQELSAEIANVSDALEILAEQAFRSFATQMDLLAAKFEIFDDVFEKPLDQLQALIDTLTDPDLGFLPKEIRDQLKQFDLTTPEGRAGLDQFIRELFTRLMTGDFSVLGALTPDEFKRALLDVEGLLDEIAQNTEEDGVDEGTTESAIIRRSITEVTGNRMVGVLTTIAIINQGILAIAKEILLEMGGTLPTDLQAITFRAPATQLDILEIEQQQLERLVEIRDLLAGGNIGVTAVEPISIEQIPFVPDPASPTPGLQPSVTINNPSFTAEIQTTGPLTEEDARLFAQRGSDFLVGEVDLALGRKIVRGTTSSAR